MMAMPIGRFCTAYVEAWSTLFGDGIEELADFPVAFVMVLAGQDISPADEDQGQQGDDPIIYGNDDKQQDGNQEEKVLPTALTATF